MAKVTTFNGTKGTAEGFSRYFFRGSPTDQFEHRPEVGEVRVMSVTVECVASGFDQISDGIRHKSSWKVVNATLGEAVERPAGDPELPYEGDDDSADGSSYGDYTGGEVAEADADADADADAGSNVVTAHFSDNS
ncbi:DUF7171 family protein [Nocardia sp. NPDC004260]